MTEYVILLPGDESAWEQASMEGRKAVYARHQRFAELLQQRGHTSPAVPSRPTRGRPGWSVAGWTR